MPDRGPDWCPEVTPCAWLGDATTPPSPQVSPFITDSRNRQARNDETMPVTLERLKDAAEGSLKNADPGGRHRIGTRSELRA